MTKTILFLADGMADDPLDELGGKTPVEYAKTPYMDRITKEGASGEFLTLPDAFGTSSDIANTSVLGYDLNECYCGRGPLEALSQGIELGPNDVAYRCNLIYADGDTLVDYSGGHISEADAKVIMTDLAAEFNCDQFSFHSGVSYRNLLILHGEAFTEAVEYEKPDANQGNKISGILPKPKGNDPRSATTCELLIKLMQDTRVFLENHPINKARKEKANMIWPWSPGRKPKMQAFQEKYACRGAIISGVDVIYGLGAAADMSLIRVPGTTGFIDTNYEGKADAAVKALDDHDFVYLHVEAIDECGHMGDIDLKLSAIEDMDTRVMKRVMDQLEGRNDVTFAILPDHPVPVKQRIHTRTPVPFSICGPHIVADQLTYYSERTCPNGSFGYLKDDQLMKAILNLK